MEYFLKFLGIVAWPGTVLILVFAFRSEVRGLVQRITNLKYKDWEASFEKAISSAEEQLPQVREAETRADSGRVRLERLAEVSPRAAILEAWIELEQVLLALAEHNDVRTNSPLRIIRELETKGVISTELAESFYGLRNLRNEAAHVPEFAVEERQAQRYINLASGMGLLLKKSDEL